MSRCSGWSQSVDHAAPRRVVASSSSSWHFQVQSPLLLQIPRVIGPRNLRSMKVWDTMPTSTPSTVKNNGVNNNSKEAGDSGACKPQANNMCFPILNSLKATSSMSQVAAASAAAAASSNTNTAANDDEPRHGILNSDTWTLSGDRALPRRTSTTSEEVDLSVLGCSAKLASRQTLKDDDDSLDIKPRARLLMDWRRTSTTSTGLDPPVLGDGGARTRLSLTDSIRLSVHELTSGCGGGGGDGSGTPSSDNKLKRPIKYADVPYSGLSQNAFDSDCDSQTESIFKSKNTQVLFLNSISLHLYVFTFLGNFYDATIIKVSYFTFYIFSKIVRRRMH